ncbi:MAG: carboxypeptidase-like regulatory domain-containing protein [Bacteroidetes bacterium]|nr:carboxypeptidase-like regulatory domain-containing protein [Bacteroidota bacterium]MBS1630333.1 carboxypeptidase-like regulatory domain-containing protein [Bacteroidota bacterium]
MHRFQALVLCLFFSIISIQVLAQQRVTVSGYIRDARSNETLPLATVYVKELGIGTQTNNYGFYSINMPAGQYTLVYSYVGYQQLIENMQIIESRTFNAELQPQRAISEVVVTAERKDENVRSTDMGTVTLDVNKMKTLPVIFGEADILKTMQLMPGVQSAGEGNSGFYVRGGGPDQNLILLDDAVVYNTGHLFGFFSVFNSDALKNVTLIKGSMPANYGGRLSSVVDVTMKDGNSKEYHATGGIGLIASRLTLEGPINKGRGSFMLSGRRTYIDLLIKPFAKGSFSGSGYYFYDANLKANYNFGKRDRIYLSGYFGRDKFTFASESQDFKAKIPWGNSTATLRYNHLFSDKVFINTTLVYNDYKFSFDGEQNDFAVKLSSGIKDWNAKSDLDWFTPGNHHVKAGINYTYHTFMPNQVSGHSDSVAFHPDNALLKYAHEAGVYILDDFDLLPWLKVNAGLRYSWFGQVGPYTRKIYDAQGIHPIDSTVYAPGTLVKSYGGLEPRLNLRFALNARSSIKASAVRSYQYIHLVSNNGSTLPTDIWVPSTYFVQPQEAWQYSLGYFRNFKDNMFETSVEVYYKDMKHQIEYREGYTPSTLRDPERDFVFGNGDAYGTEFFINKAKGRFTGWIGYTLSWTWRQFPLLNNGERFPAKYDRRHDVSLVASYKHSKRWTFSAVFVYGSGNAVTLPTNYYFIDGQLVAQYSKLNAYRLFPYHRLDLSAVLTPQHKKPRRWQGSWAFSIYNVYSRQNPYFLYVDTRANASGVYDVKVKQVSIFPILPSITYNFNF